MQAAISSLLFKSHPLGGVVDLARDIGVSWLEVWTEHFWRDDDGRLLEKLRKSGLGVGIRSLRSRADRRYQHHVE